jgi:hypothetical protein
MNGPVLLQQALRSMQSFSRLRGEPSRALVDVALHGVCHPHCTNGDPLTHGQRVNEQVVVAEGHKLRLGGGPLHACTITST